MVVGHLRAGATPGKFKVSGPEGYSRTRTLADARATAEQAPEPFTQPNSSLTVKLTPAEWQPASTIPSHGAKDPKGLTVTAVHVMATSRAHALARLRRRSTTRREEAPVRLGGLRSADVGRGGQRGREYAFRATQLRTQS